METSKVPLPTESEQEQNASVGSGQSTDLSVPRQMIEVLEAAGKPLDNISLASAVSDASNVDINKEHLRKQHLEDDRNPSGLLKGEQNNEISVIRQVPPKMQSENEMSRKRTLSAEEIEEIPAKSPKSDTSVFKRSLFSSENLVPSESMDLSLGVEECKMVVENRVSSEPTVEDTRVSEESNQFVVENLLTPNLGILPGIPEKSDQFMSENSATAIFCAPGSVKENNDTTSEKLLKTLGLVAKEHDNQPDDNCLVTDEQNEAVTLFSDFLNVPVAEQSKQAVDDSDAMDELKNEVPLFSDHTTVMVAEHGKQAVDKNLITNVSTKVVPLIPDVIEAGATSKCLPEGHSSFQSLTIDKSDSVVPQKLCLEKIQQDSALDMQAVNENKEMFCPVELLSVEQTEPCLVKDISTENDTGIPDPMESLSLEHDRQGSANKNTDMSGSMESSSAENSQQDFAQDAVTPSKMKEMSSLVEPLPAEPSQQAHDLKIPNETTAVQCPIESFSGEQNQPGFAKDVEITNVPCPVESLLVEQNQQTLAQGRSKETSPEIGVPLGSILSKPQQQIPTKDGNKELSPEISIPLQVPLPAEPHQPILAQHSEPKDRNKEIELSPEKQNNQILSGKSSPYNLLLYNDAKQSVDGSWEELKERQPQDKEPNNKVSTLDNNRNKNEPMEQEMSPKESVNTERRDAENKAELMEQELSPKESVLMEQCDIENKDEPMEEVTPSKEPTEISSENRIVLSTNEDNEDDEKNKVDRATVSGLLENEILLDKSPLSLDLMDVNKGKEFQSKSPVVSEFNLSKNSQQVHIKDPSFKRLGLLSDDARHLLSEQSLSLSLLSGDRSKPLSTEPNSAMESMDSRSELLPPIPCFEEDTRSSWNLDAAKTSIMKEIPKNIDEDAQTSMPVPSKETMLSVKHLDEDSRLSVGSQKSQSKRRLSDDEVSQFPAERLFEYQWPSGKGEFYLLQEHVSEFLRVKSFKRKYPEFGRRPVDIDERKFLKDCGVVSETQCDLGLTAVRSDDVLELMSKDYPYKYQEYLQVLQERERQKISNKHKEYATALVDKAKINDFMKKAINSAAEYNAHLNQDRREERKTSFDLQTYTLHIPTSKIKKLDKEATKVGKYPVALIPGQYQDSYRVYTSEELKYFPLNTVLYGPLKELSNVYTQASSDGSQSDSDDSESGSCCSSSQGTHDGSMDSSSGSEQPSRSNKSKSDIFGETPYKPKDKPNAQCKACQSNNEKTKELRTEDLVHCSECDSSYHAHPSCLDLTPEMVAMIKTYPWQCMDCKTCSLCMDPYDEDKMMFCDKCDRGYHTFCVGLKSIPSGRWICQLCGQCASCGSRNPGPDGSKAQWHQEIVRAATPSGDSVKQLFCVTCVKQKKHR